MASENTPKKNWFARHKILTGLLILILIGIIGSAAGGGSKSSSSSNGSSKSNSAKQYRFADRADKQPKDVEVLPNETATIGGVQLTVSDVQYKGSLSDFETADSGKIYAVMTVSLANNSGKTQPYNAYNFRVQTASGQVLDSTISSIGSQLNSGDLVAGGKVTGVVVFEVPQETGHQYLIWKPGLASDRAIVQIQ